MWPPVYWDTIGWKYTRILRYVRGKYKYRYKNDTYNAITLHKKLCGLTICLCLQNCNNFIIFKEKYNMRKYNIFFSQKSKVKTTQQTLIWNNNIYITIYIYIYIAQRINNGQKISQKVFKTSIPWIKPQKISH